jgi:myosin-light-chain kinase
MGASRSKFESSHYPEDIREKYKIGAILGIGTFGQVRECISEASKESFAVKIVDYSPAKTPSVKHSLARAEAELLAALDHPNIVSFIEVYEDAHFLYVVMELCPGGEVFEKLVAKGHLSDVQVVSISRQMFSAIEFLHSIDIVHRDIKAENFLFASDGTVKLIDFGFAVRLKTRKQLLSDIVGSPHYIAPEMLNRRYSHPVDMWSMGVLLFLMIFGRYPFDDETDEAIFRKIRRWEITWQDERVPAQSRQVIEFVQGLLNPDPLMRTTPIAALNSQFLRHRSSSEKNELVLVPEVVTERLSKNVIAPSKSRRKQKLQSDEEKQLSQRILDLDRQFESGKHRGRRLSTGRYSQSLPSSPSKSSPKRQVTRGLLGLGTTTSVESSPSIRSPQNKRSRSLPGTRVTFDAKPPDIFVYNEGSGALTRVPTTDIRKNLTKKHT